MLPHPWFELRKGKVMTKVGLCLAFIAGVAASVTLFSAATAQPGDCVVCAELNKIKSALSTLAASVANVQRETDKLPQLAGKLNDIKGATDRLQKIQESTDSIPSIKQSTDIVPAIQKQTVAIKLDTGDIKANVAVLPAIKTETDKIQKVADAVAGISRAPQRYLVPFEAPKDWRCFYGAGTISKVFYGAATDCDNFRRPDVGMQPILAEAFCLPEDAARAVLLDNRSVRAIVCEAGTRKKP